MLKRGKRVIVKVTRGDAIPTDVPAVAADPFEVVRKAEPVRVIPHETEISSLAYLPNGTIVTSSAGKDGGPFQLSYWPTGEDSASRVAAVPSAGVSQVVASLDGRWLATGSRTDNKAILWDAEHLRPIATKVWDTTNGEMLTRIDNMRNAVEAVAVSPDSPYLIAVGGNWGNDPDRVADPTRPNRSASGT